MSTWTADLDEHVSPDLSTSALVTIDTQVDFCDGGVCAVPGTTQVLPAIGRLLNAFRTGGRPVVHVVRLYDGADVDLLRRNLVATGAGPVRPGSPGSQIAPGILPPGVAPLDASALLAGHLQVFGELEWAMWKPRWGAFHRTSLNDHLRSLDVSTVVLAGCNYPNCTRATAYGASEHDYRVLLAADAISGVLPQHLEETGRMGIVHALSSQIVNRLEHIRHCVKDVGCGYRAAPLVAGGA